MTNESGIITLSSDEEETQSAPLETSTSNPNKTMTKIDEKKLSKKRSGSPIIPDKSTIKKRIVLTTIQKPDENDNSDKLDLLKPGLVECERRPVKKSSEELFTMFIGQCLKRKRSPSMDKIVSKLKRHYEQMDEKYAQCESFINLLNEKRESLMNSDKHLYTNISCIDDEMKNYKKGKNKIAEVYLSIPGPSTSKQDDNIITKTIQQTTNDKMKHENKKVHKIMLTMAECRERIKKLEEAEVDFDDENNSNYIKLEKYKTRITELHYKLCELTGESKDANRSYLRPKHFKVTKIPSVDQAINSFINKKLKNRTDKTYSTVNSVIFPDYNDIFDCINNCNNKQKLGMTTKAMRSLAKSSFEELGQQLQRERELDYWDTFSMWFKEDEDPAKINLDLRAKLDRNREEGEEKLKKLFDEYVVRQEKAIDEPDDDDDDDNDDDEKSSEKMDEDDDEDDEDNNNDEIDNIDDWEMSDEIEEEKMDTKSDTEPIKDNEINDIDTDCDKNNTKEILNNNKTDENINNHDKKNNDNDEEEDEDEELQIIQDNTVKEISFDNSKPQDNKIIKQLMDNSKITHDKKIIKKPIDNINTSLDNKIKEKSIDNLKTSQDNKITEKSIDNLAVVIENIRVESFKKVADNIVSNLTVDNTVANDIAVVNLTDANDIAVVNLTDAIVNLNDAVDSINNTVKSSVNSIEKKTIDKKTDELPKKSNFLEVIVDSSDIIDKPEIDLRDDEKIAPTPDSTTSESNIALKDIEVIEDNIETKIDENIECETAIKPQQPMLKLRSFAKQPDFWNNSQNTIDAKVSPKKTVNNEEPIVLVNLDDDDNSIQVLPPPPPPQVPITTRLKNAKVIGLALNSTDKQPKIIKKLQLNPLASRSLIQLKNAKTGLPRLLKSGPSPGVVTGIRQVVTTQSSRPISAVRPLSSTMVRPSLMNSQPRPVPAPVRQQQRQPIVRHVVRPLGTNVCKTYGFTKTITTKPVPQRIITVKNTSTTPSSSSSSTISSPTALSRVAVRAEGSGTLNLVPVTLKNGTCTTINRTVNNTKS
ncbi:hypothetical protein HCN44_005473 [Aphidius gifuensis]|uniref:Daxx histone-binding domain-containing protein n=1 Tax=Aphidius gifuensis TaxID=684658 RepID=A0A834Y208_APHGI|nr:probable serine/threonine-protein kinase kinX [Aphidius gifuensis]KAF7997196.1 hypothetical protein HCN44_005473 [Aphidius gifuensis]